MLTATAMTLETTYAFQLRHDDGSWSWYSQAEYTSAEGCKEQLAVIYGGAFAAPDRHRIVKIERTVIE